MSADESSDRGKSTDDPLQIDWTSPVDLFPYGMAAVGEISLATLDGRFAGTSSARSSYILPAAAPPSVQNEHKTEVERMVLRSIGRTKERAKSSESPAAKGRFWKMVWNKDLVEGAVESYIRIQKKKDEPFYIVDDRTCAICRLS